MDRPSTLIVERHRPECEHLTPNKAKVQAVCKFNDAHNIFYDKKDVFEHFGVPRFSGYKILNSQEVWRHHNQDEKDS